MIKLGDFGLAVQLEHSCSKRSTKCGTSWYMAPEVYDEATVLKSDVWSLGLALFHLGEQRDPFMGFVWDKDKGWLCNNDPPSLSSEKWSAEFVDFVSKCLVKDVKERWSVSELMEVRVVWGGIMSSIPL